MITVNIKATAFLRRLKGCSKGKTKITIPKGLTIRDILKYLGASPNEVGFVVINGAIVDFDSLVNDGDNLELYQIFGGG